MRALLCVVLFCGVAMAKDGPARIAPDSLLHFAGISYGDTEEKVVELFGTPEGIDEEPGDSFFTMFYENTTVSVLVNKRTKKVFEINIAKTQGLNFIRSRGVSDDNFKICDLTRDEVVRFLGRPGKEMKGYMLSYRLKTAAKKHIEINFITDSSPTYDCLRFHWPDLEKERAGTDK